MSTIKPPHVGGYLLTMTAYFHEPNAIPIQTQRRLSTEQKAMELAVIVLDSVDRTIVKRMVCDVTRIGS